MISNRMTRAEMIKWLGDAIRTETEKPFDNIDHDFVDECSCLLVELMGKTAVMSDEEIAERMAKLNPDAGSVVQKKSRIKLKRMWKIAIAAAVVLCMGITVLAVPAVRMALLTALQLDVGESTEVDGLTYTYAGVEQSYASIEDLRENVDFCLPHIQSNTLKLKKILCIEASNIIVLYFNDTSISYNIWLDNTDIASYALNSTKYSFSGYTTYIVTREASSKHTYHSYTLIGNDIHVISSNSLKTIELLINSIY